jgi:hypothetical protein
MLCCSAVQIRCCPKVSRARSRQKHIHGVCIYSYRCILLRCSREYVADAQISCAFAYSWVYHHPAIAIHTLCTLQIQMVSLDTALRHFCAMFYKEESRIRWLPVPGHRAFLEGSGSPLFRPNFREECVASFLCRSNGTSMIYLTSSSFKPRTMEGADGAIPAFLAKVVDFSEGISYELLQPLTNFRHCHDGTPAEARIVFLCRQLGPDSQQPSNNEFVMKIKVQYSTLPPKERQK